MTRQTQLLGALALVLGVLALLARTNRGAVVVASVADAIGSIARGLRNNNPGNVRLTSPPTLWDGWVGPEQQSDPEYVQMVSMAKGVRMALVVFRNYQARYGLTNIYQMIGRWAPPGENDTDAYRDDLAAYVGVDPGTPIDLRDRDTAYAFLRGVFRHENGVAAELIPAATMYEGIEEAST